MAKDFSCVGSTECRLGEYISIRTGRLDANAAETDGEYPFFTCAREISRINSWAFDCECVLVAGNCTPHVSYYNGKFNAYQRVYIIESNDPGRLSTKYLYYFFKEYMALAIDKQHGAIEKFFCLSDFTEIKISLPDLPTQLRIAGILGSLDEKIELNRKKIAEFEALAKTIYDYWFVQFDFPDKNGKPYKSSGGKMVWNEQLKREVPEGWEVVPLESLLARLPITKRLPTDEYGIDGEFPIIDQSEAFIAGYSSNQSAVLSLPKCVVFGDHSCTVKMVNFPFCRGADGTQILVSNDESVISTYQLYLYIEHLKFDGQYKRHFSFLKQFLIPLKRTLYLGQAFSNVIEPAFDSIRNCREAIRLLIQERDTLLPLLMNGQVSVGELK